MRSHALQGWPPLLRFALLRLVLQLPSDYSRIPY